MRKYSVNNSPINEKKTVVGFQQVAEQSFGNRDMKLLVFGGQQQPVHGKNSSYCGPINVPDKCSRDCFYEKLDKLHESSGLTFIFNLREAKLDLYLLYEAVTERGGFQEVSKHGKWKEVASIFNLKNQHTMLPCQFQKVYENLLYRYEQTYFYRMPVKASTKEGCSREEDQSLDCLSLKRKYFENRSKDCAEKVQSTAVSYRESTSVQYVAPQEFGSEPLSGFVSPIQKADIPVTWDDKKSIDNLGLSTKPRTGYQLFLREECDRLKKTHGESPTGALNFRVRASEKWKNMSDTDRQPYREASQKERDIYYSEVPTDEQPKLYKRRRYQKRQTQQSVPAPNDDKPALVTMEAEIGNPSTLLVETENRESNFTNDQQAKQYKNMNTEADIGNPSTLVEMENRESNATNDHQTKQFKNTETEADIGNPSTLLVEMENREINVTNDQQTKQYKDTNTEADIGNPSTLLVEKENSESNITNDQQTKQYKNMNTEADIGNPSTLLVEMENSESNVANDQQTKQFKNTNTEADIRNPSTLLVEKENSEMNVTNDQQTKEYTDTEADIGNPSTLLVETENRESNVTDDQQTKQYNNTNTEADIGNPSTLLVETENRESNVTDDQQTKQYNNTNTTEHEKKPTEEIIYFAKDDVYHVKLEPDVGSTAVMPDESLVESTIQALKNARPTDPIFQANWADLSDFPG